MGMRTYVLSLYFIATLASAAIVSNPDAKAPAFSMKSVYRSHHTMTCGPKSLITHQQIITAGVTSLSQALGNLGGVQLRDLISNGNQVSISMRGFGSNATSNTLFLINGIPITNPDLAPPDLNAIPVQEIEYIEITAGSESVLYGDQAVGGVINIITRQYARENINVSVNFGSYQLHNVYASLHHTYDALNNIMTLARNETDNYRDNNHYAQNTLHGNHIYTYCQGTLHFDYKIANENMRYPGALTAKQVRQNRRQAANDNDFFRDANYFFLLQQQHQFHPDWIMDTAFSHRRMYGDGVLTNPFGQNRLTHYLRPQLKGKWCNTIILTGLDIQDDRYHLGSLYGVTNDRQQKYGVFGLAKILTTRNMFLSLGARAAQQNASLHSTGISNTINRAFATTIGATYQLTNDLSYYLRRAESFRFPKADENAFTPPTITSLRTQRGVAYETGWQLQREAYSGKIGLYHLRLRDEINFDPLQTPLTPFGSNRNLPPTIRYGASASGKVSLFNDVSLDGQYNYVKARFQNGIYAGNRIPLVSEHIFRSGIDCHCSEHMNIYLENVFTGSQFAANDDANRISKVGGYTVFNLNTRYVNKCFSASLHLNNIFNKQYYFYNVYSPYLRNVFYYPAPERNVILTLQVAID